MSIFKKFFNISKKSEGSHHHKSDDENSMYIPENSLPIDEKFIENFTNQGGRFLYCLDSNEVDENLQEILQEHNFINTSCYCPSPNIKERFKSFNIDLNGKTSNSEFFLSTCEFIIADSGAILFSSNQVREFKSIELPDTYIIIASTSQIVESIGEGLRGIKVKNNASIPSNITTLKHFREQSVQEQKDLMHYGSAHKTVYLLLLEDL
jgi:L-lactate utilization protein LutB